MRREGGWAYAESRFSETYSGPVATREEAVRAALADYEDNDSVAVAEAQYPDPAYLLTGAMMAASTASWLIETLLERLDEFAVETSWWSGDDPLFEIHGEQSEAEKALIAVLIPWADKYIEPKFFSTQNVEEVKRDDL